MKRILIINPFGIGDVLFTTPAIRAIRDGYPDVFVGYWCNERVKDLLKDNPNINKVFALSKGDLKKIYHNSRLEGIRRFLGLIYDLKKEKFDISLDFSLEHRYSLISKLLGIKKRIGFDYKKRGRFLTDKVDVSGYNHKHVVEYYLELLVPLDIKPKSYDLDLSIPDSVKVKTKTKLKNLGIRETDFIVGIAVGAGASWGKDASLKHWSAMKFAQLADTISTKLGAKVLILGDESERPIADIIVSAMIQKPIDFVGKNTLEELVAVIGNLSVLVTNDGGPLHLAVAQGVKTVSIFGPVSDLVYGPYPHTESHLVINKNLACRPCYKDFKMPFCEHEKECLNSIAVEEVFNAIRRLM